MKTKEKNTAKSIKNFGIIYTIVIIFAIFKLFTYLKWTFQLVKNWQLPNEPFFSKVNLINSDVDVSLEAYLIYAILYMIAFSFVILGIYQLKKTMKLFIEKHIFQKEISLAFKKAGKSFLIFIYGTYIIDVFLIIWTKNSNRFIDLLSTELFIFLILGYLMFFLSDIFKEGIAIREENELTI